MSSSAPMAVFGIASCLALISFQPSCAVRSTFKDIGVVEIAVNGTNKTVPAQPNVSSFVEEKSQGRNYHSITSSSAEGNLTNMRAILSEFTGFQSFSKLLGKSCVSANWWGGTKPYPVIFVRNMDAIEAPEEILATEPGGVITGRLHLSAIGVEKARNAGRGLARLLLSRGQKAEAYWQDTIPGARSLPEGVSPCTTSPCDAAALEVVEETQNLQTFELLEEGFSEEWPAEWDDGWSPKGNFQFASEPTQHIEAGRSFGALFNQVAEGNRILHGALVAVVSNVRGPWRSTLSDQLDEEDLEHFRQGLPESKKHPTEEWTTKEWGRWLQDGNALVLECMRDIDSWQLSYANLCNLVDKPSCLDSAPLHETPERASDGKSPPKVAEELPEVAQRFKAHIDAGAAKVKDVAEVAKVHFEKVKGADVAAKVKGHVEAGAVAVKDKFQALAGMFMPVPHTERKM